MKQTVGGGFMLLSGVALYAGTRLQGSYADDSAAMWAKLLCVLGVWMIVWDCWLRGFAANYREAVRRTSREYAERCGQEAVRKPEAQAPDEKE